MQQDDVAASKMDEVMAADDVFHSYEVRLLLLLVV
jgi:hypothetical protein